MDRAPLANIPLIDTGRRGPAALLESRRPAAEALLAIAQRRYGRMALSCGDAASRAWLRRNVSPYRREIEHIAQELDIPGSVILNLSYEWGCSGLVEADPVHGARLLCVLDWRLDGLGRHVVVTRADADAGPYYSVTWPGAVGVTTAMAPGRFAAAIHQAPMRRHGLTLIGDWAKNRSLVWRSTALAPAHLLRHVFETAADFAAARRALADTRLALPVIFLLTGIRPGQACVIERLEDQTIIHDGPGPVANSWRDPAALGGRWSARGRANSRRLEALARLSGRSVEAFEWVVPPVLNRDTRLAVHANAAIGDLAVLGYEARQPATYEFQLRHKGLAAA